MASPIEISTADEQVKTDKGSMVLKIIKLTGQLDESNVDDVAHQIYDIIDPMTQGSSLAFDLSELTYLNSKSIGYLTDWHLKMKEKDGEIVLVGAPDNILDILNVVGLTQIIKSYESLELAVENL